LAVECLVSWDVIWQPDHVAEEDVATITVGLGDGWVTTGRRDLTISDKLGPFDL